MFHIHFTKSRSIAGAYAYDRCRCGARRTLKMSTGYSALMRGWPVPRDGWVKNEA